MLTVILEQIGSVTRQLSVALGFTYNITVMLTVVTVLISVDFGTRIHLQAAAAMILSLTKYRAPILHLRFLIPRGSALCRCNFVFVLRVHQ